MSSVFPFDPIQTVGLTRLVGPTVVSLSALVEQLVFRPNPARLWWLAMPTTIPSSFDARPGQSGTDIGIRPFSGQEHIRVSNFDFPGLVQQGWWLLAGSGVDVVCWECWVVGHDTSDQSQ